MILRGVKFCTVWYYSESDDKIWGESSAQYDTAQSQVPRSIILHGVNGHFLKLLHRPLKGQCHRNKYKFRLCSKKATFSFLRQCSRITFFFTPSSMILREVSFFHTSKLRISQRKRNQIRKYFNPLVSNRRWVEWWKQLEVENVVGLSL